MNPDGGTVLVLDDDVSVREAISSLLRSVGLSVIEFGSASELRASQRPPDRACLVLDVRMPDVSGLDLHQELEADGDALPVVFITGHGDIPMAVRAMKAGAVEFLSKPFRDEDLLTAIRHALCLDDEARARRAALEAVKANYSTLTARQREVLDPIVSGKLNKQVAAALGVSEQTIKVHRHNVMHKMQAASLPDLVRMVDALRSSGIDIG